MGESKGEKRKESKSRPADKDVERALEKVEKERLVATPTADRRQAQVFDQGIALIRVHLQMYPKVTATVVILLVVCFLTRMVQKIQFAKHTIRHSMQMDIDFSELEENYEHMRDKIRNWCLFGSSNDCSCEDPSQPMERVDVRDWAKAHRTNVAQLQAWKEKAKKASSSELIAPDVIFLGDDLVEGWHGRWMTQDWCNSTSLEEWCYEGHRIKKLWKKTFGSGDFFDTTYRKGLALGIAGDRSNNLLWRIKHDEAIREMAPKVWWLSIGTNDLTLTGCSEEVVVLGILRVAEELALKFPSSKVVIQALFPRSNQQDGSLYPSQKTSYHLSPHLRPSLTTTNAVPFEKGGAGKDHPTSPSIVATTTVQDHNIDNQWLWPSIQRINKQLEYFARDQDQMIYFDADKLVLGILQNAYYSQTSPKIMHELMPDYKHLSFEGYQILQERIEKELERIIQGHNYSNDIEEMPPADPGFSG